MPFMAEETMDKIIHELDKSKSQLARIKEENKEWIERIVTLGEVGIGALGVGFLNAKYANSADGKYWEFAHVPADLGGAVAFKFIAWFDLAGKQYSPHLDRIGDGFWAAWLYRMGGSLAASLAQQQVPSGQSTKGLFGAAGLPNQWGAARAGAFAIPGAR